MRTRNEYVEEINPNTGKKQRRKVGLLPVQREGLDYEFDLVGYMDDDNTFLVYKTRCPLYRGNAIPTPSESDFRPFLECLKGAKRTEQQRASSWISAFKELEQMLASRRFV